MASGNYTIRRSCEVKKVACSCNRKNGKKPNCVGSSKRRTPSFGNQGCNALAPLQGEDTSTKNWLNKNIEIYY